MRKLLILAMLISSVHGICQSYQNRVYEARYMDKPPVFLHGRDSLNRFYFSHFPAFDTLISLAVRNGDTAKYLRVYFTFQVDENGFVYEPAFEKVASTRSAVTESAKTLRYFNEIKPLLQRSVAAMLEKITGWRPGLQYGMPVKSLNYDYLQFWVGLSAPQ